MSSLSNGVLWSKLCSLCNRMTNGLIQYQIFMSCKCASSPERVQNHKQNSAAWAETEAEGSGRLLEFSTLLWLWISERKSPFPSWTFKSVAMERIKGWTRNLKVNSQNPMSDQKAWADQGSDNNVTETSRHFRVNLGSIY